MSRHEDRTKRRSHWSDNAVFVSRLRVGGDGLRVAIKDVVDIAGFPTCAGSRAFRAAPAATRNAGIIDRLIAGNAAIVGKTNMHELSYGLTGRNAWTGSAVNPLYPAVMTGGSSSGSAAAVAAALCDVAVGTDTGGSIRLPAACCGIYGLKTTFGRVSRQGVMPEHSSLDCVGPLAREPVLLDKAMAMLASDWRGMGDERDWNIGWVSTSADPAIAGHVRESAGLCSPKTVDDITLDHLDAAHEAALTIIGHEMFAAFGDLPDTGDVGADVAQRLRQASTITEDMRIAAEDVRSAFSAEVDAALERVDLLAMPTLPTLPFARDVADGPGVVPISRLIRPFNLSGHPALAVPVGEMDQRPVSLQVIGRPGADECLVAFADGLARTLAAEKE